MAEEFLRSTNIEEPFFGPEWPVYPAIDEFVQVTGSPDGNNVYPAFIVQFSPPLSLRQRVACFVWEPNRISLPLGYYNCRLSGVYGGDVNGIGSLPLYVTNCCRGTGSSLSSH
jgi:hypothetical protein